MIPVFVVGIAKLVARTSINPLMVVSSESMEPNLNVGDIIYITHKDPSEIQNGTIEDMDGDIIVFNPHTTWKHNLPPDNQCVVHRVVGKMYNDTNQKYYFLTKGDNNDRVDPQFGEDVWICEDDVFGVVTKTIPKVGYVRLWISDPSVYVPLIFVTLFLVGATTWYDSKNKSKKICLTTAKSQKKFVYNNKCILKIDNKMKHT